MNTIDRHARRLGRWLGAVAVLSATTAVALGIDDPKSQPLTTPPSTPAPPAASKAEPAKPLDKDKKIVFDQRDKRWMDVLEWLSTETGLPLICPTKPTGSFTFIAPIVNGAQKKYTIPEI